MPGNVRREELASVRSSLSTWPEVGIGGPDLDVRTSERCGDSGVFGDGRPVSGAGTYFVATDYRTDDARQESNDTRQETNEPAEHFAFVTYE